MSSLDGHVYCGLLTLTFDLLTSTAYHCVVLYEADIFSKYGALTLTFQCFTMQELTMQHCIVDSSYIKYGDPAAVVQ